MFGNFLYFIIVLLIYSTYPATEPPNFPFFIAVIFFILLSFAFAASTRFSFQRLEERIGLEDFSEIDYRFNKIMNRQTIMAVLLFAILIYGLGLSGFTRRLALFSTFPTLEALLFLGIFVGYLAIVWSSAYPIYRKLYGSRMSRRSYVQSNILFALPVLLPWLLLSSFLDIIQVLPFDSLKAMLRTPMGEVAYFLFFLVGAAVCGPAMVRHFWGCTPLEPGPERSRIEALCERAELDYADILYWPIFEGRMITAGVMGLVKRFRYILVTEALLETLEPEEIDAVIAHEIGHVKRRHLLFYLFFFIGYMQISYGIYIVGGYMLQDFILSGINRFALVSAIFALLNIAVFIIYFRYIFGYFMRNFERQADGYVYHLFDSAKPLISTFAKIVQSSGQSPDKPNWHHFSISERVGYLLNCESDRRWLGWHDKKVLRGIAAYTVAVVVFAAAAYQFDFGATGREISAGLLERIILAEAERTPDDPDLHRMLGDLYYDRSRYDDAAKAYETALNLDPDNADVLNKLAWLHATSEADELRNPRRALHLAERAAALSSASYVLDTLAESYYINGRFEEAELAGRQALEAADENREHYKRQLKKFRRALEQQRSVRRRVGAI